MDDMLGSLKRLVESARFCDVGNHNEFHAVIEFFEGLSEGVDLRFASDAQLDIEAST